MCKTIRLPEVLKILAGKWRLETMNVFGDLSNSLKLLPFVQIWIFIFVFLFFLGINSKRSLKRVGASGPLYLSSQLIYILNLKDQHSRNDLNMIMTDNDEAC